jgi:hypothetical protein
MSLEQLPVHRWSDVSDQIALPPLPDGASISNGRGRPVRLPPIQTSPTSSSSRVASVSSSEQHDTITTLEEASASNVTRSIQHEGAEKEDDECVICLDELVAGKALFTAECGHRFHFSCLLENVNHDEANADKCPICRKPQTQWPEHTEGLVKAHPYCEYQLYRMVMISTICTK